MLPKDFSFEGICFETQALHYGRITVHVLIYLTEIV